MAKIDDVCKEIYSSIDGALAFGVVDLQSGMLVSVHHTVAYFSKEYLDAVSAAAVDFFRGKTVSRVETLISKQRGQEAKHYMDEMFMTTERTYHFMKLTKNQNFVVVLVTKTTSNQGLGWSVLRSTISDVEGAL